MSSSDLAPEQTTHTSVRPISVRSAETSSVRSQPRWTPPMPPVAMKWIPAMAHTASVPATVVAPQRAARRRTWPGRVRPPCARRRRGRAGRSRVVDPDPDDAVDDRDRRRHGAAVAHALLRLARRRRGRSRAAGRGRSPTTRAPPPARPDQRPLDLGRSSASGRTGGGSCVLPAGGFLHHGADATLAGVSSVDPGIAAPVTCANHPKVETRRLAARTAASRSAPTAWCRRRSGSSAATARACRARHASRCAPQKAARAVGAAFGVGSVMGVAARLRRRLSASGSSRSSSRTSSGCSPGARRFAAAGYSPRPRRRPGSPRPEPGGRTSVSGIVIAASVGGDARAYVQVLGLLVAGFFAYREVS